MFGEKTVHFPRPVHLALDADPGGQVLEENAVGGLVDLLAARAGTADEFFEQIRLGDAQSGHALLEVGKFVAGNRVLHRAGTGS